MSSNDKKQEETVC